MMLDMASTKPLVFSNKRSNSTGAAAVSVRRANLTDAGAIAAICRRAFALTHRQAFPPFELVKYLSQAFDPQRVEADMVKANTLFLVAEGAGSIVGSLRLERAAPAPPLHLPAPIELSRLYLEPSRKGQGIGSNLMRYALGTAVATGARSCWLGVWRGNIRAIQFYRRWGFNVIGTDSLSLGHTHAVGLLMSRPL